MNNTLYDIVEIKLNSDLTINVSYTDGVKAVVRHKPSFLRKWYVELENVEYFLSGVYNKDEGRIIWPNEFDVCLSYVHDIAQKTGGDVELKGGGELNPPERRPNDIVEVKLNPNLTINVLYADETKAIVSFRDTFFQGWHKPMKDVNHFMAGIYDEDEGAIEWPNGYDHILWGGVYDVAKENNGKVEIFPIWDYNMEVKPDENAGTVSKAV